MQAGKWRVWAGQAGQRGAAESGMRSAAGWSLLTHFPGSRHSGPKGLAPQDRPILQHQGRHGNGAQRRGRAQRSGKRSKPQPVLEPRESARQESVHVANRAGGWSAGRARRRSSRRAGRRLTAAARAAGSVRGGAQHVRGGAKLATACPASPLPPTPPHYKAPGKLEKKTYYSKAVSPTLTKKYTKPGRLSLKNKTTTTTKKERQEKMFIIVKHKRGTGPRSLLDYCVHNTPRLCNSPPSCQRWLHS